MEWKGTSEADHCIYKEWLVAEGKPKSMHIHLIHRLHTDESLELKSPLLQSSNEKQREQGKLGITA